MNVVTKCWRVCSPSLTISMPACCCSCKDKRKASCFASSSCSPSSFQGDQSFSGSANQDGFGKLPAVDVGSKMAMSNLLSQSFVKRYALKRCSLIYSVNQAACSCFVFSAAKFAAHCSRMSLYGLIKFSSVHLPCFTAN